MVATLYVFYQGGVKFVPLYRSHVPNLERKPALWQKIIHFSYILRKQLDSHHKILKPNIAVSSFWVSRLEVAPSMSNMHWKHYIFKERQCVNWYTVLFSLKTFKQFLEVFKPLTTWWVNSTKMTTNILSWLFKKSIN